MGRGRLRPRPAVAALSGAAALTAVFTALSPRPPSPPNGGRMRLAPFFEPGFPFVESTVDARYLGPAFPADNLAPRALVLPLGRDAWAAFDTDLLRLSVAWHGGFLSPGSIAMLSYDAPLRKLGGGEHDVPRPHGEPLVATGLYPGWAADEPAFEDPRERGPDPADLGRGPLAVPGFDWEGVEVEAGGAVLRYRVAGREVAERWSSRASAAGPAVVRDVRVGPGRAALTLVAAEVPAAVAEQRGAALVFHRDGGDATRIAVAGDPARVRPEAREDRWALVRVAASDALLRFEVIASRGPAAAAGDVSPAAPPPPPSRRVAAPAPPTRHWPERVVTRGRLGEGPATHVVDVIALPEPNPWGRRVRPADVDFFPDGRAAVVTFDGDVYLVSGLDATLDRVSWQRVASGFNEPQSVRVRDDEIFVFSRGGLARLIRDPESGETVRYESFARDFTQSADTRDFALSLALLPDGGFLLSKGGQQVDHRSRSAGRVLAISADGAETAVFASGLRNAYVAVHGDPALVTASDQQGHWVPSTPVHVLERGGDYGFAPAAAAPAAVVDEPPLWLPYRIAQSGIDQVRVADTRLGPALAGALLYVDYQRPGLVAVLMDENGARPTAATPLPTAFSTPLLKGEIGPHDGGLYLVGFQVWGSNAAELAGFCRVRLQEGRPATLPVAAAAHREGVLLRFASPLEPEVAAAPGRYSVASWSYRRSPEYGSPQLRADGTPGTDPFPVHTVLVGDDDRSVFLAIPGLAPADQLEVRYSLRLASGEAFEHATYMTPRELPPLSPAPAGFGPVDFAALFASRPVPRGPAEPVEAVSSERGERLFASMGCGACHSLDGTTAGRSGPSLVGVAGLRRPLLGGGEVTATTAYLRESIEAPGAKRLLGYDPRDVGMPSYLGVLTDDDVASLVLFIESLGATPAASAPRDAAPAPGEVSTP